jgi:hypothetical protein
MSSTRKFPVVNSSLHLIELAFNAMGDNYLRGDLIQAGRIDSRSF